MLASSVFVVLATIALSPSPTFVQSDAAAPETAAPPGNVLLVVMDDIGPDMLGCYGIGTDLPPTPRLDALAAEGILFRNMYANPAGSVTMATVETGRVAELTGVGYTIYAAKDAYTLPLSEVILPELLDLGTGGRYATALFGKWFLGMTPEVGGLRAPLVMGYDHYEGVMEQLYLGGDDFFSYGWIENGVATPCTEYATTKTVDRALDWMLRAPEPWFCHVDFHAADAPVHIPPAGLFTVDVPQKVTWAAGSRPFYKAVVEALDAEIGRMLDSLAPELRARTTVIVLSDNGTPKVSVAPPLLTEHGKSTVFEGGIHVPMIVSGYAVREPGREVAALAQTTDLFRTVADLAGVDLDAILPGLVHQSIGFYPHVVDPDAPPRRDVVFAQLFHPNGRGVTAFNNRDFAARDGRYKLIVRRIMADRPAVHDFFDLQADPFERNNLLLGGPLEREAKASYDALKRHIDEMAAL